MGLLPGSEPEVFAFGPFVLDRQRRVLTRAGAAVAVTPKAFDLLVVLVRNGGAVVSKDVLMSELWPDTAVEEGNLTFQVSTLRKALGSEGSQYVATIPGRGYQFAAPLQRVEMTAAEMIVQDEERTTITVSDTRRSTWLWAAGLAIVALIALGAVILRNPKTPPSPLIRSLAVLPFKPLVAAERDESLELGMADTLITSLSRMPGIVVRPTSAIRRYSKLDDDPLEAGRTLGVDAVVDGSIQRSGSRMRVTVRLLRTSDGHPIWSSRMDDDAHDLFAMQDHVADSVARALVPALSGSSEAQIVRRMTTDVEAYELYAKGRYWMWTDTARAEPFFRRALERDPRFAAAWAGIADMWLLRGRYSNYAPGERLEKARAAALKAVALDPELADGHAALAQVYADRDWDWSRAEREYLRALELNPNSDVAHGGYAYLLLFRRDFDGALEHVRRATDVDPLSPAWSVLRGLVLYCSGRNDEAIRYLQQDLALHPQRIPTLLHLGMVHTVSGKPETGLATFEKALALGANRPQFLPLAAFAHAKAGHRDIALGIVREVEQNAENAPIAEANLALAWTALGDHDRAFYWLDRGMEERSFLVRMVTCHPGYDPLRRDPRYADLVRRMGL